ncbi:MAG: ABC transporter ATP-binding protein [Gammaproteobacteria bacterium]|nr:ABC transporter ATP-binding protein [Gammaproteobacteria bacterium]
MASPEALLSIEGLHVSYGTKEILHGIGYGVSEGEVVAVLGANGSGKSTSLNAISGFVAPTSGSIVFDGAEITAMPAHRIFRLGVVQVSQSRDLFPDLSVEDNLRLGATVRNRRGAQEQLERVFRYFPRLSERRRQQTRTLSGGEQQMVAIGRAVMARPRLLLLDEPSGGLAPQFINEIGNIIQALKDDGATMLMVEQNLALAFKVADRFIILRDGRVSDGGFVKSLEGSIDDIVRTIYL